MISKTRFSARLMCGAGAAAVLAFSGAANAEVRQFDIPALSLGEALARFGTQSDLTVVTTSEITRTKSSRAVSGTVEPEIALAQLLEGTDLTYRREGDTFLIVRADDPQSGSAAGDGAEVEALIVTAQKKEEDIQDVPIAISAFTQQALEAQKIEGGFDLLKAIPNVTFSKSNFSSYNFSIRGVGTKAISATTDPGVAVSFNNTALIQNRLFEQEYFDIERVEVLRGPQGTLYGRNATSGVINVISAKPDMQAFAGSIKGEVGNYDSKRLVAMLNVPVVEDVLALRFAGSMTSRDGYDFNSVTGHPVNGRDLWSARATVAFNPTERIRSNVIWERFEEDDDRSRTGKQLCHRDDGPDDVGGFPSNTNPNPFQQTMFRSLFTAGCKPGSMYDAAAFGTPNGMAMPFIFAMAFLGNDCGWEVGCGAFFPLGWQGLPHTPGSNLVTLLEPIDPYGGMMQSPDLRVIASAKDPIYRAKADVVQLNLEFDVSDDLTLYSQTVYNEDRVYSFQDYNRFNTIPVIRDTSSLYDELATPENLIPSKWRDLAPGGYFCDPQLGCLNTVAGFDISKARGAQWGQEIRLQSSFDGPLNFSAGANYTYFKAVADYYVMYNIITAFAMAMPFNFYPSLDTCYMGYGFGEVLPMGTPGTLCPYIDPNPVESINGEGHNYFRSKNPYKLDSRAVFGEVYWQATDSLKVTAGLRYTADEKTFTPVPTQILMAPFIHGGVVNKGYPAKPDIVQTWGEFTGRLGLDWKPALSFTDETMLYGFYSRGYKGGGANPPGIGLASLDEVHEWLEGPGAVLGIPTEFVTQPYLTLNAANYPPTFEPEFVNAFEIGVKNTVLGGAATVNLGAFFYDYKDYQVSKIVDRTAVNENFDARIWGFEIESAFHPSRNLQIIANLGYLDTEIGEGARSIDITNRTQGNEAYILAKPWFQLPSNCIAPAAVARSMAEANGGYIGNYNALCGGYNAGNSIIIDPATNEQYDPFDYPEINGGAGIYQNLEGNELPNSPHWTMNVGAQYGVDFLEGWRATVRGDVYWQSQSWARVYNAVNDKLHGWYNANLSLWIERPEDDLRIEIYAKNLLDKTPITDAFINSDDTANTTNVFVLDPRLIGLSIRKGF